ncbi:uncharacterized protein LOC141776628 isoform X1 [Sebastes fasciatus]|uniref:uncharacterized protein LOC141776628 isoform X1 n=1 Tax=Sebastes fasciatus TaxID=394691 RepID=UPI003D9E851F
MAGGSRFIWIPVLLSCVFQASDNRHVGQNEIHLIGRSDNPEVDRILSKIPITLPEGIDPRNINVTSITIKTCTGVKEQLVQLNTQLQQTILRNIQLGNEAFGSRRELRQLQLQLATCSSTASAITGSYQAQLLNKMKQLLERFDSDTFLILNIIALTREVNTLQKKINHAANATETTDIHVLQRELQQKINELSVKTQQIERSHTNSALILQIISLQNEIWDLEQAGSRRRETNPQPDKRILALQAQLDGKISELRSKGDADSAMLELTFVHSKIVAIQRLISYHIEESRTKAADYQRQWRQKVELLKKKILQLTRDENNQDLTQEIFKLQAEVDRLRLLMTNAKKTTDARIKELRVILEEEKKQQENLQKHLEEADYAQAQLIVKILGLMKEVRELDGDQQHQTTSTSQGTTLQTVLQAKEREFAKAQEEINELQRKLRLKSEKCSGLEERYEEVKTEFEQKIAELNRTGDSKAALVLNVINLHDDVKTLKDLISTTQDPDRILELQRQLQEKQDELNSKTADIESLIPHPKIILTVIELQNEIWELQKKAANGTTGGLVEELQTRLDGLITDIGDDNTKLMLKIITLQSQVEQLQRRLSDRQMLQAAQVTQLTNDLATKKEELQKYVNELNEKNQTNARLILATTDLHNQLRNLEKEKHDEGKTTSAAITKLREQLKATVEEHSSDQAEIKALQNKLNQTEGQCSSFEDNLKDLQNDLDAKMKELQSKSDSVTSLALQVSTLTLQLEELKRQLQNTESETKIKELQKMIDEKNNELAKKTEELKERSAQPQRLLQIITLQTEIEKLANVAANDTDYNKIRALQDHLNNLIDGIQDENNENTKLMFKILAQQDEIARLEKQEKSQTQAAMEKIKDLENELEDIRNQIKEKTMVLDSSDTRISDLSAQIMGLHKKIKPLEEEISDLKDTNAENVQELQKRLDLTKTQLQDSENRLKDADAKNFNSVMEIADLRTQLKKAQKKASKAAEKNTDELEQQLQTQQRENSRLENTNKELTNDLATKKEELQKYANELNEKSQINAKLILNVTDLHNQLRNLEKEKHNDNATSSLTVTQLWEQLKAKMVEHSRDPAEVEFLDTLFQAKEREHATAQAEVKELQKKLQLKSEKCSGLEERYEEVKTEFEQKIAELNRTGDSKAALVLNVINLHDDVKTLKDLISTTQDPDRILELQRKLEEKQDELNSKTADIERLIPNSKLILTIIELQNEIWDLQKKADNETTDLQNRVDGLISEIDDKGDDNTKMMLKIITLQSQVEQLQSQLSDLQMLRASQATQLTNDLTSKKEELQKYVNELNEKNQTNARLILATTDLHNQLRNLEKEKHDEGKTTSAAITKLREQLKATVEEHSSDQAEIKALQNKLNQTEGQCSSFENNLKDLQNDLDAKMKELQSKSDSVTSLALQISTLTLQLEELKRQLQNTESETKIKELQKMIDDKNNELAKKTEELKERSAQPQRLLHIITLQTEIEKLVNVAANDTDYNKIRALQDHLNYLIDGIQDENNENTKLMFKILAQQDEIARLEKQEKSQTQAAMEKIKDLENELEDIRNQIKEKTMVLDSSDTRISDLSAQIMGLHKKIKPLEEEISDLKETNAENVEELQKRLNLTKTQLQDSEHRLKDADAKNFNSVMEIADLRTQLKKAQKKASKAAEKNIDELEQQLQTQQRQNRKLENTNKDLKQEVKELKMCCTDVNTECDDLQRQLQQSQEDADRLQQQLHDKDATLDRLQQELEEKSRDNNTTQQKYNNLERQLQQSQKDRDRLQQQLHEKDATLNQLQQELEEQRRENNTLQHEYDNLERHLHEKDATLNLLQQEFEEQTRENNRLQAENDNLLNEKNKLEGDVEDLQNKLTDVEDTTVFASKMTLDPNTAHPRIALSADNTEVSTREEIQDVPDHPGRFDGVLAVLGKTGFSAGRRYWEVSIAGKSCYHLGMASESAQRKGPIRFSPTNGYWTVVLSKQGQYRALDRRPVIIPVQIQPVTLGILLDYKKGQISFYDAGTRSHMYTFVGQTFTDKIYPFIDFCVEDDGGRTPIVLLSPGSVEWIK